MTRQRRKNRARLCIRCSPIGEAEQRTPPTYGGPRPLRQQIILAANASDSRDGTRATFSVLRCGPRAWFVWDSAARGRPHHFLQRRCQFRRSNDRPSRSVTSGQSRSSHYGTNARRSRTMPAGWTRESESAVSRSDCGSVQARWLRPRSCFCAGQNAGSARHVLQIPAGEIAARFPG